MLEDIEQCRKDGCKFLEVDSCSRMYQIHRWRRGLCPYSNQANAKALKASEQHRVRVGQQKQRRK